MVKLFASNRTIVIALIPIFVLFHLVVNHYFPAFNQKNILEENFWGIKFHLFSPFFSNVFTFLFICGNAILINYIFNTVEFYKSLSYLPSLFYVLLIFLFPISFQFNEGLIADTFFLLFLFQIFRIRQNVDLRNTCFLAGLFLGIASTFFPEYIFLLPLVYFTLLIVRPFVWRENFLPLLGCSLPFLWVYLVHPHFISSYLQTTSLLNYSPTEKLELAMVGLILFVLLLIAFKHILSKRLISSIRFKKLSSILIVTTIYAIVVVLFISLYLQSYFYPILLLALFSMVLPHTYLHNKHKQKWIAVVLIHLLLFINIAKFFY